MIKDLIYGWGNEKWSALEEYLRACVEHASATRGPILECGSGLSTIMIGVIAQRRGIAHWALEHDPEWAARVSRILRRCGSSSRLHTAPLRDHGDFCWYDPPLASMPRDLSLVICDGPPGSTKGGRHGLVPVMRERLSPNCVVLLDDAGRQGEFEIAKRWTATLGATLQMQGTEKPYVRISL